MNQPATSLTDLRRRETAVLYATPAAWDDRAEVWRVTVSGSLYGNRVNRLRRRLILGLLQQSLRLERAELRNNTLWRRLAPFIAAGQNHRRVAVQIGSRVHALHRRTDRQGFFAEELPAHAGEIRRLEGEGAAGRGWLHYDLATPNGLDPPPRRGSSLLIPQRGWSVISDIDDTMKHTGVTDPATMLANTFLRPYQAVEGMAARYCQWARQGAVFHYVSASSWQLYAPLTEMCRSAGFPPGAFHLQPFRWRDHVLRRAPALRGPGKRQVIRSLLARYPHRQFVLVGDTGDWDPEIYADASGSFPTQIRAILLRQLAERPLDAGRERRTAPRSRRTRRLVFWDPEQLPCELSEAAGDRDTR